MTDIKPMQLGEILDGALTIFGRNLGLFTALGIIALAGPLIFFALLSGPLSRAFVPLALQMRMGAQPSFAQWQPLLPLMGLLLVGLMFYYIASYFLTAGAMRIISDTYLGRRPLLGDAVSLGASKMLPLVGVALCKVALLTLVWVGCVIAVVVLAGLMGLVGPRAAALATFAGFGGAVWVVAFVMCGYGVTAQVLTLEDGVGVFGAFARSWDLTRQRKLKVFWTALLSAIVFYVIPYVIVIVVATVLRGMSPPLGRVVGLLSQFMPILCAPLVVSCLTLLYYDLRVRREGFDLQLLSQRLGVG
jgi:hypothetical protein